MMIRFSVFLFLTSCGPASLADLRTEGESQTRRLVKELRAVETKEDLQKAVPQLKKQFNKLAELLVEARKFTPEDSEPSLASEELFAELARLYEMADGRELIESAQADAIHRLR